MHSVHPAQPALTDDRKLIEVSEVSQHDSCFLLGYLTAHPLPEDSLRSRYQPGREAITPRHTGFILVFVVHTWFETSTVDDNLGRGRNVTGTGRAGRTGPTLPSHLSKTPSPKRRRSSVDTLIA